MARRSTSRSRGRRSKRNIVHEEGMRWGLLEYVMLLGLSGILVYIVLQLAQGNPLL